MIGTLYIVATPIGNLNDFSNRAVEIFKSVDIIACEDTRQTKKLLSYYKVKTSTISYHTWNEIDRSVELCKKILDGMNIALVSDAGTPCISDPGFRLVREAHRNQIKVSPIPGSSSLLSALSISGLPSDKFFFEGFLPKKKGRKKRLDFLNNIGSTVILFESPYRILKTLNDINHVMGDRYVTLCRELTKKFEEVETRKVVKLIKKYENIKAKGEFVIIISKEGYQL